MTVTEDAPLTTAHGPIKYDTTDFANLTPEEQLVFFEVNGYLIIPGMLDAEEMATVVDELEDLPMTMATRAIMVNTNRIRASMAVLVTPR